MDLSTYKIIHLVAAMILFFAFGGLTLGARLANGRNFAHRQIYSILHGAGLLLLLISGFGQIAKLGVSGWPPWIILKITIWFLFGLSLAVIFRLPRINKYLWLFLLSGGALAAYLGTIH